MIELHHGDCLEVLRTMPDNSVDAIVTDPPYGLSFMGNRWDYDVPSVEVWAQCLRVLKPGGHLLAFAGTRTQHRMCVRIEDAGFEIRDMIAWVYGSGFPKSLDVSKAIDKVGGDALAWRSFSDAYAKAVEASPFTHSDIDRELGIKSSSCYWARVDHRGGMPPIHHWEKVRSMLDLPAQFARLYEEAEREVVGQRDRGFAPGTNAVYGEYSGDTRITAPATDAARQWQGWGTALKPALEPITVARKPLIGTVAANVLAYGTGALNIDGCRVAGTVPRTVQGQSSRAGEVYGTDQRHQRVFEPSDFGRWPANLIHDGSDEVLDAFPQAPGQLADASTNADARKTQNTYGAMRRGRSDEPSADSDNKGVVGFKMKPGARRLDKGSAARFFYCAKADREDRNDGCDGMARKPLNWSSGTQSPGTFQAEGTDRTSPNHHPTVKPTDLMRYLCRMVTPAGGLVLDPFMGSGSTGRGAVLEGLRFVGIELDAEYLEIARARIDSARRQGLQPSLDLEAA